MGEEDRDGCLPPQLTPRGLCPQPSLPAQEMNTDPDCGSGCTMDFLCEPEEIHPPLQPVCPLQVTERDKAISKSLSWSNLQRI